jgi:hypothetical protein
MDAVRAVREVSSSDPEISKSSFNKKNILLSPSRSHNGYWSVG